MLQNTPSPFESSTQTGPTQTGSAFGSPGDAAIEVRPPALTRTIIPAAMLASSIIAPAILYVVVQPPLNLIFAALFFVMEVGAAAFVWHLFNSQVLRADASGVSMTSLGKSTSVRWEEIATMEEMRGSENQGTVLVFKNAEGERLLTVPAHLAANKTESAAFRRVVEEKLRGA